MAVRHVVLTSNGPGELYTWAKPVLEAWRRTEPQARISIALVPCQFANGTEPGIAGTFGAANVTTAAQYAAAAALGRAPAPLQQSIEAEPGDRQGLVLSLGGNGGYAVALARRLRLPAYRYAFLPYFNRGLDALFVPDEATRKRARLLAGPGGRVETVGNLVADAMRGEQPHPDPGQPHVLLMAGSRDAFALPLIPFMLAVAERLQQRFPGARFVWPRSRLLKDETVQGGVSGVAADVLGGVAGRWLDDDRIVTAKGTVIEVVPEDRRYAHMKAADLAVTIPGTNTLELGIAGVPSVVVLPLNRPEIIPLAGPGHWLSLIPWIGVPLKRQAVRTFVQRLRYPVSLPNQLSGEALMEEVKGIVSPDGVAERAAALLDDPMELGRRRERLLATMPAPGAADRLVARLIELSAGRTGS